MGPFLCRLFSFTTKVLTNSWENLGPKKYVGLEFRACFGKVPKSNHFKKNTKLQFYRTTKLQAPMALQYPRPESKDCTMSVEFIAITISSHLSNNFTNQQNSSGQGRLWWQDMPIPKTFLQYLISNQFPNPNSTIQKLHE